MPVGFMRSESLASRDSQCFSENIIKYWTSLLDSFPDVGGGGGGGGYYQKNWEGGGGPFQNPYPIYDQNG